MVDEPMAQLTQSQPMAHRNGTCANKALPALLQGQTLYRASGWVGAIEHPHCLAMRCCLLKDVQQGRDEGVDAASQILKINQHDVESRHHLPGWTAHFAVKAEYRDVIDRIGEIGRFHHIILLVALQPMLWSEGSGDVDISTSNQRVERMFKSRGHRSRMGNQCNPLSSQFLA